MIVLQDYNDAVIQIDGLPYQKGAVKPIFDKQAETMGLVFLDTDRVITTPMPYSLYKPLGGVPFASFNLLVGWVHDAFFLDSSGGGGGAPAVPIAAPGVMDTYVPARKISSSSTQLVCVDLDNTAGRGYPTKGWQLGMLDPTTGEAILPVDSRNEQISAMIHMTLRSMSASASPTFIAASCPDTGLPNGFLFQFQTRPNAGVNKVYPKMIFRSNMGEYCGLGLPFFENIGLEEVIILQEASSAGVVDFTTGKRLRIQGHTNDTQFNPLGYVAMTDAQSMLYAIQNGSKLAYFIRPMGDVHFTGCLFVKQEVFTTDLTLDFTRHVTQFKGTSATTLTLPDPAETFPYGVSRAGETHKIINMGSINLTLSRPVYLDDTTSITSLSYAYPDNRIEIMSDGTRWIVI